MSTRRPAFVLVHGAWHGAATWHNVAPLLEAYGYETRTLDLPGAGALARTPLSYTRRPLDSVAFATEASPNASVTQGQRTDAVIALVEKTVRETGAPAVLVGHSLGGLTASAVAEAVPQCLHGVVYLSAFMLPTGMTAMTLITHPTMASALVSGCILAPPQAVGAIRIDFRSDDEAYRARLRDAFAGDVSETAFAKLRAGLHCDEPLAVFQTPVVQTRSGFGQVRRHYVRCLEDRAIPLSGQDFMIDAVDAEMGTATHIQDLPASHSPFEAQPAALAAVLVSIADNPAVDFDINQSARDLRMSVRHEQGARR